MQIIHQQAVTKMLPIMSLKLWIRVYDYIYKIPVLVNDFFSFYICRVLKVKDCRITF